MIDLSWEIKLSIVIPTINRYDDLEKTIGYLQKQNFEKYEILIIDQTDQIKSRDLTFLDQRVEQIYEDEKSASKARNIGLKRAKGDVVLFLDDDVIIESSAYLTHILSHFDNPNCSGVVGPIIPFSDQQLRYTRHALSHNKNWGWLFFPRNYGKNCKINDGGAGNLSVRRSWAIEVGGMDENYRKGAHREESDFNVRYTGKFGWYDYDTNCALVHIGRRTGGIRNWDTIKSSAIKAQHHYIGFFYFLIKNVSIRFWVPHLLSGIMFFFFRKDLIIRPWLFLLSVWRFLKGFVHGIILYKKGPKYISADT